MRITLTVKPSDAVLHYLSAIFRAVREGRSPELDYICSSNAMGIYFHIPFCKRICAYCDFFRCTDLRFVDEVLAAMRRELLLRRDFIPDRTVRTVYFGGGTPSLCSPEQLGALLDRCRELFDCSQLEEVTVEANPDDLTPEYLASLHRTGIDRLSIGIQSLDDDALKRMNRRHTAAQAAAAVHAAREAGFRNISADIIYGLPFGGAGSLERTLDGILGLNVEHISAYHLTIEPGTAFDRLAAAGRLAPIDEAESERQYLTVHRTLTEAGYEHYEISNFARRGFRSRHNSSYWHSQPYLGIGPAAHSFDGLRCRMWAASSISSYLENGGYTEELLSDNDRYNEIVMTSLRCAEGIDLREIRDRFGTEELRRLTADAARFIAAGELVRTENRLAIPPERWLASDALIAELFV